MKTLTELYDTVQTWRQQQGFDDSLTNHDIIQLMVAQALLKQDVLLERIGDKLVEVETAIDRLRLKLEPEP